MPHIHQTDGHYDATVSAFILNPLSSRVLLLRHKILGLWVQPGGHVELHEHPWQALAHELLEETGYSLSQLQVLQSEPAFYGLSETVHPTPLLYRSHELPADGYRHYHTDAAYGLLTEELPLHKPAVGEAKELHWFSADELSALPEEQIIHDSRAIALQLLEDFGLYRSLPADSFEH